MRNTSRVAKNAVSSKVVAMEKEGATFEQVRELVAGARGKMVYAPATPTRASGRRARCRD